MATFKFKIGDEVRRINHDNGGCDGTFKVGQTGVVCKIHDDNFVDVKVNGKVNTWNDVINLELVKATPKFKVGDKIIGNYNGYAFTCKGWKGIVTRVYSDRIDARGDGNEDHNGLFTALNPMYFDLRETSEKIVITHDGKTTTATKYCEDGSKVTATARCAPEDEFDFNVGAKLAMERLIEKIEPVVVDGFKVGDRVNYIGVNGTIICIATDNQIGVEFDKSTSICHDCKGISLKAGTTGTKGTSRWVLARHLKHGEVKYYNGKVVVTDSGNVPDDFIIGKIYTFVDGWCKNERGYQITASPAKDFEDLVSRFSTVKFVEIVE